ncbi:Uncharacterized conserved protein, DUF983 family [Consotaella salsifontis]|uniref:Uncharacterized conserved protein, DUF983 family n=2 Tax=Consotaella salsifontis TaxID=1365950 RepID=A0A1T4MXP3_9HYPH|nr:Uncharacterized conserved protein, DUF983 family [Consotaella salsifontis]
MARGARGRCPRCGEGHLFDGYLTTARRCDNCGLDYAFIDSGDGPAVFVILGVSVVVCALALWLEVAYSPPIWVHFALWIPLILILCLPLLRILKGAMIGQQYRHRAAEGRLESHDLH